MPGATDCAWNALCHVSCSALLGGEACRSDLTQRQLSRSTELESRVAVFGTFPAEGQVLLHTEVVQQLTGLAGDVGAHVPGLRQWKQRARRQVCHVLRPRRARGRAGLDPGMALVAQVAQTVGDPVSLQLGAGGPVAERGGALWAV